VANVENTTGIEIRDLLYLLLFIIKVMIIEIMQVFIKAICDISGAKYLA
jgi:hypothetical protein